ncbi:MAG: hypothetical protein ACK5Y8_16230 [Betaproteobacteria bacterium]|jgi:hypothetical protein
MPRPSVIPAVLLRLEQYLEQREAEYLAQPEAERTPTLPATGDGKVNVRQLAAAIGLKQTQEKYLFERAELSGLINLMAEGQGLAPIGARLLEKAADAAVLERLARKSQEAKLSSQAAVEAEAVQAELLQRIGDLEADNQRLHAENLRLRTRLDLIDAGTLIPLDD